MRNRSSAAPDVEDIDVASLLELNCQLDLSAERQAEVRKLLFGILGPYADPIAQLCSKAAADRRVARELREQMAQLREGPQVAAIVTAVHNGRVRLLIGGTERLLPRPDDLDLGIGQTALLDGQAHSVVGAGDYLFGGQSYAFHRRLDGRRALVRPLRDGAGGESLQLALVAENVDMDAVAVDDRVLCWSADSGNLLLVTCHLGPHRPSVADEGNTRSVAREDIVGLEEILEEVELLFLEDGSPEALALLEHARQAIKGFVLQGVPGSGKTLVAEYLITLVRLRGGRALYRTASYYLSKWVGEGSARVREDFALLEAAFRETGVRPLLVVDELEGIALDRSHVSGLVGGHLDILDTLLSSLNATEVRMIGISNVANRIVDTALMRAGRLRVISFPSALDARQVAALVAKCLSGIELEAAPGRAGKTEDLALELGEAVSDLIFAPGGKLAELLRVQLGDGRVLTFGAGDLATPAAIADGIVYPALVRKVQRSRQTGESRIGSVTLDELRNATERYFVEHCKTITRDNVRSILPDRIPEDQSVVKVERTATRSFSTEER
jgi:hypothetical protein